jgi:hypothetical protein
LGDDPAGAGARFSSRPGRPVALQAPEFWLLQPKLSRLREAETLNNQTTKTPVILRLCEEGDSNPHGY